MCGTISPDPLLLNALADFLHSHAHFNQPFLLALSGGPDSLALLLLLRKLQERFSFQFGIAHVDHGWRSESQEEADQLQALALQLQIPFHRRRLDVQALSGNLEAACRLERFKFFRELSLQEGYQAVLLGHHADDQAETVLKRVLEGNTLSRLGGLQTVTDMRGLLLWRPLLPFPKERMGRWLQSQNAVPFLDTTNLDPRFLRGRFRTEIIPLLSKKFGKEVAKSLSCIGQESQELASFLKELLEPYIARIERGAMGDYLDLSNEMPQHPYLLKSLVKVLCSKEEMPFPRDLVQRAAQMLLSNQANKRLCWKRQLLYVDRRRLFFLNPHRPASPLRQPLALGETFYGQWRVKLSYVEGVKQREPCRGWKQLWKGGFECFLPVGAPVDAYEIGPPLPGAPYLGSHALLDKWWNNEKVPACLRYLAPVIWQGGSICREFLAERIPTWDCGVESSWLHVEISLIKEV